jgi:N-acetylneuraminic acid mutarotase
MKILLTLISFLYSALALADGWVQRDSFPGPLRAHPYSFSIGDKGYIGGGDWKRDLWEYDPATNHWTQKAYLPVAGAALAPCGFSIGDKGYVLSFDSLFEYDPPSNTWTGKSKLPAEGRGYCASFTIGSRGYIVGGWSTDILGECWQWDQPTNVWTQKASLPFQRGNAVGFAINGKGYFATGEDHVYFNHDLWEYDPNADTWTQKARFPGIGRNDVAAFVICNYAYVGIGGEAPYYRDFYRYYALNDTWTQVSDFGGTVRDDAAFFTIGKRAYVGLGQYNNTDDYGDFWEYIPNWTDTLCTVGIDELSSQLNFSIYPNPANNSFKINYSSEIKGCILEIYNMTGEKIYSEELKMQQIYLNVSVGIYLVKLSSGEKVVTQKLVVE